MFFNLQHSIVGNNDIPGVTLLETQGSAQVEEQRLKSNISTIGMLSNANGKRPPYADTNGPPKVDGAINAATLGTGTRNARPNALGYDVYGKKGTQRK